MAVASGLLFLPSCNSTNTAILNNPNGLVTPKNTYTVTLTGVDKNGVVAEQHTTTTPLGNRHPYGELRTGLHDADDGPAALHGSSRPRQLTHGARSVADDSRVGAHYLSVCSAVPPSGEKKQACSAHPALERDSARLHILRNSRMASTTTASGPGDIGDRAGGGRARGANHSPSHRTHLRSLADDPLSWNRRP